MRGDPGAPSRCRRAFGKLAARRIYQLLSTRCRTYRKVEPVFQLFVLVRHCFFVWAIDRVVYDVKNNQTCVGADPCTFHAFVLACAVLTSTGSTCYSYSQYRKMRRKVDDLQQGVAFDAVLDSLGKFSFVPISAAVLARAGVVQMLIASCTL